MGAIAEGTPARKVTVEGLERGETLRVVTSEDGVIEDVETYHPDGTLCSVYKTVGGHVHGEALTYDEDGALIEIANFELGKKHGLYELFHPNGVKVVSGAYVRGRKDGRWLHWSISGNGRLEQELTYADGELHGECRTWDESGNLLQQASGLFEKGQRVRDL